MVCKIHRGIDSLQGCKICEFEINPQLDNVKVNVVDWNDLKVTASTLVILLFTLYRLFERRWISDSFVETRKIQKNKTLLHMLVSSTFIQHGFPFA